MTKLFDPILPKQFFRGFPEIVEDINIQSIQCPICYDVCTDAVIENACGHTFCSKCLEQLFKTSKDGIIKCPQTRTTFTKDQTGPNRALRDLISQLKVACVQKYKGCLWQGSYFQLEKHLKNECRKVRLKCLNTECNFLKKRRFAENHISQCEFRLIACHMCNQKFTAKNFKEHEGSCSNRLILCPYGCLKMVKSCDCQKHFNEECLNKVIECEFKADGCSFKSKRLGYQDHLKEAYDFHIKLLRSRIENVQKEYSNLANEVQANGELSAIENLQKTIQKKTLEVAILKEELEATKQTNEKLFSQNQQLERALMDMQREDGFSINESVEFYDVDRSLNENDYEDEQISSESSQTIEDNRSRQGFRFDVQKEGWMYKKSKFLKKWRMRWFVLTSTYLYSYQQEKNYSRPTEQISLRTIRNISEQTLEAGFYTIQIRQKDGVIFHLKTNVEEEKDSWIREIQKCLENKNRLF